MDKPRASAKAHTASPADTGRRVIAHESDTLKILADSLDENFDKIVELILKCPGRVVVSGVGKSGIIGRKISATFLSTGTPSMFLHPTEGVHGDLGAILPDDVVILISNSGESDEIMSLMPALKTLGVTLVGITGKPHSSLGKSVGYILSYEIDNEADKHNMIPTASTAAQLALGDALAIAAMEGRGLNQDDLARRHPGGSIGKRLTLKVSDLMTASPDDPRTRVEGSFREALFELTGKRLGAVSVVDNEGFLKGIITDGDIKRLLEKAEKNRQSIDSLMDTKVTEIMIHNPRRITEGTMAIDALRFMESHQISQIPVVCSEGKVCGMLRLLDLVKSGM